MYTTPLATRTIPPPAVVSTMGGIEAACAIRLRSRPHTGPYPIEWLCIDPKRRLFCDTWRMTTRVFARGDVNPR